MENKQEIYVKCIFCDKKERVYEYTDEVLERGWYGIKVRDKYMDCLCECYACADCVMKIFEIY